MTPTNRHTGTAPRGSRRAFLLQAACGLLAALIAAPAPALAQGVIQFSVGASTFRIRNLLIVAFARDGTVIP
jgi:hypothetical protein